MSKRTVLVTGATGGVASALVRSLDPAHDRVALVSRNAEGLDALRGQLPDDLEACTIVADVSTAEGADQAVVRAAAHFGEPPARLAHCAGSALLAPLHRTTQAQYRDCMAANQDSAFYTLRAWVKARLQTDEPRGSAVLFSSVVAQIGVANHEAIAMAKGAIASLVPAAAATYAGHGIRVNGIAPRADTDGRHRTAVCLPACRGADRSAVSAAALRAGGRPRAGRHMAVVRRGRMGHRPGPVGGRRVLPRAPHGPDGRLRGGGTHRHHRRRDLRARSRPTAARCRP